jgi:cytoskeletal protein CcmA (bactofilin family)
MLGKPETSPSASVPPQARRFTDSLDTHVTVIGPDTRFQGELTAEGPVDVAGSFDGDAHVAGHFRIREGARVTGRVEAQSLVIEGQVEGPSLVADKVEIGRTARVRSNIEARVVAIADGAFFEGAVRMVEPGTPMTFKEKRAVRP